jgi:hypothetical protein
VFHAIIHAQRVFTMKLFALPAYAGRSTITHVGINALKLTIQTMLIHRILHASPAFLLARTALAGFSAFPASVDIISINQVAMPHAQSTTIHCQAI